MKAQDRLLYDILNNPRIRVIPNFQRNYSWDKDQFERLWSDIESTRKDRFLFLGTIMEKEHEGKLLVIDGQQRLTTFYIIFCILRDLAREFKHTTTADEIQDRYLIDRFRKDDPYKLISKTPDHSVLKELAEGQGSTIPDGLHRKAYDFFKKEISKYISKKPELIVALRDKILGQIKVIHAELDRDDDEFTIFECLNATGLQLSQSDLIRNAIMMKMDDSIRDTEYLTYWQPIEDRADLIIKVDQASKDRVRSEILDDFFFNYLKSFDYLTKQHIYKEFRQKYDNAGTTFTRHEFLSEVVTYFDNYARIFLTKYDFQNEEARTLWRIRRLNVTVCYPFLLTLKAYQDQLGDSKYLEMLRIVENIIVRTLLAGEKTNGLNKVFIEYSKKLRHLNTIALDDAFRISFGYPTDEQIKSSLPSLKSFKVLKNSLYAIFQTIEDESSLKHDERFVLESGKYQLEHILPQKGFRDNGYSISNEDYEKLIHTIGNLTLISPSNNSSASNKPFEVKKSENYTRSNLRINRYFDKVQKWNAETILERTQTLTDILLQIYPDLCPANFRTERKINLTSRQPIKITIGIKEYPINTIHEGLRQVIDYAIEKLGLDDFCNHKLIASYVKDERPVVYSTEELPNGKFFKTPARANDIQKVCENISKAINEPIRFSYD